MMQEWRNAAFFYAAGNSCNYYGKLLEITLISGNGFFDT